MIEIRGLEHSLGNNKILDGINLTLAEGSVMGLVGINGAGKTTLLRLISGVYRPDVGAVLCDGVSTQDENARKKLFFLPDDPYFTTHTTGKALRALYSVFYPEFDEETYKRHMATFKLDENKAIRNFSKGMRRQLFVALALAVKPKYLLLDEAFDGLDPLARLSFKRAINEAVEQHGMSVLISSHSLRELEDFCDSYALIDQKRIVSSGDISERVNSFCKFQLAFARDVEEGEFESLGAVSLEKNGRFVRIVMREGAESARQKLEALAPAVMEEMPMDFEELFIREVEGRGYLK